MSPDLPFERRGGDTQVDAMHNRIAALERIKCLTGVDLANKSTQYKQLIDIELYSRWYKNYPPDHKIDEQWCQRVAEIVRELDKKDKEDLEVIEQGAGERVKELYQESLIKPAIPVEMNSESQKISLFGKILNVFQKKETRGA